VGDIVIITAKSVVIPIALKDSELKRDIVEIITAAIIFVKITIQLPLPEVIVINMLKNVN